MGKRAHFNKLYIHAATILGLIVFLSFALFATGCAEKETEIPPQQVFEPVSMTYVINNPLDINHITVVDFEDLDRGLHVKHQIIAIQGLIDQAIEKKINDRIREVYDEMIGIGLPPFRGIKVAIPENALQVDDYVYAEVTANYNNILSVSLGRNATYAIPDKSGNLQRAPEGYYITTTFIYYMEGLTFDLTTGQEVTLQEVFADDVPYLSLLNDKVSEELNRSQAQDEGWAYSYFGPKLTGPFQGLTEDQKFYLNSTGICLIFDYDTPQFYSEQFMATTMQFLYGELDQTVGIADRFYRGAEEIYQSAKPQVKSLLWMSDDLSIDVSENYVDEQVQISLSCRLPSLMEESLKEKLSLLAEADAQVIDDLKQSVRNDTSQSAEQGTAYYERSIHGTDIGGYYSIMDSAYWGYKDEYFYQTAYQTYRKEDEQLVEFSDLFLPGYDYISLLEEGLRREIKSIGGLYQNGTQMTERETEHEIERLSQSVTGFQLSNESIGIATEPVEIQGSRLEQIYVNLTYEEIGCENLSIFESI